MQIKEIESLYIDAADDFCLLTGGNGLFSCGNVAVFANKEKDGQVSWFHVFGGDPTRCTEEICSGIAVAAMTEAWRERLEEKHGMTIAARWGRNHQAQWLILKPDDSPGGLVFSGAGQWVEFDGERPFAVFASLPEAIVAAVKALAAAAIAERDWREENPQ